MNKKERTITTILIILSAIFIGEGLSHTKTWPQQKPIFQSLGTVVTVEPENGFITIKDSDLPLWLKHTTIRLRVNDKKILNTLESGNKINFSVAENSKDIFINQITKKQ